MDNETRALLNELLERRRDQSVRSTDTPVRRDWKDYYMLHCIHKISKQTEGLISKSKLALSGLPSERAIEFLSAALTEMHMLADQLYQNLQQEVPADSSSAARCTGSQP